MKIRSMVAVSIGGAISFAAINVWNDNEKFYRDYVMPCMQHVDSELSHRVAVLAMKYCLVRKQLQPDPDSLASLLQLTRRGLFQNVDYRFFLR